MAKKTKQQKTCEARGSLEALLQQCKKWRKGGPSVNAIKSAFEGLIAINSKYRYRKDLYPPLTNRIKPKTPNVSAPTTLAEALLWKQGDWKKYQKFLDCYAQEEQTFPDPYVVNVAFASHIKEADIRMYPIFDQHSLRAAWAIFGNPDKGTPGCCKDYLVDSKGNWRGSKPPDETGKESYKWYRERFGKNAPPGAERCFDAFLMSLGRALKDVAKGSKEEGQTVYESFRALCRTR